MLSQQTRILYELHKKYQKNPSSLTQDEKFISEVAKKIVEKYGTPSFLDDTQPLKENSGLECPISLYDIRYPCALEYEDGSISTYIFEEQYILKSLTLNKIDPTNRQPVKDQVITGKELRFLLCFNKYFEIGISELCSEREQERIKQFYELGNGKKQEQCSNILKYRLLQALRDKNLQETKELIKSINDLNVVLKSDSGYFSQLLLYYFFQNALSNTGWFNFFKDVLSEREIELNIALNEFGSTALHFAARTGHLKMAQLLLENDAGVDTKNSENATPLHLAARAGHLEIVRLLINNRADVNAVRVWGNTPFIAATIGGHIDIIKELYENGANINAVNDMGWTALRYVAQNGDANELEIVKALLECKIDVNISDNHGRIPLYFALLHRRSKISKLIVEQTCNAASQEVKNKVLLAAAEAGELEFVRLLLKHGANVNAASSYGQIPIIMATMRGHIEIIKELYASGADINAQDNDGWTALRYVVQDGWSNSKCDALKITKVLLSCSKIDINVPDRCGQTPLDIAIRCGHKKASKLLINHAYRTQEKNKVLLPIAAKANTGNSPSNNTVGKISNQKTAPQKLQVSTYDDTSMHHALGAASISLLAIGVILCAKHTEEIAWGGICIAGAIILALIIGIMKICEEVNKVKQEDPDLSTYTAVKTVIKNIFACCNVSQEDDKSLKYLT